MKRRSQTQTKATPSQPPRASRNSFIPTSTPAHSRSRSVSNTLSTPAPPLPLPLNKSTASSTTSSVSTTTRRNKLSDSTNLLRTALPEELLGVVEDEVDWKSKFAQLEAENAKLRSLESEVLKLRPLEAEHAKLRTQLASLSQRPTKAAFEELQKDYSVLEGILEGTQRENALAEEQIKFLKERQRKLEEALEKFVGPSWAEMTDIPPISMGPASRRQSKLYAGESGAPVVLPTLVETSFATPAPTTATAHEAAPLQDTTDTTDTTTSQDDIDMDSKSQSVTPVVNRFGKSVGMNGPDGANISHILDMYKSSMTSAFAQPDTSASRPESRASAHSLSASMLSHPAHRDAARPGRLEDQPAFQAIDRRVRALETIVQKFIVRNVPEHVGELSMVRDDLEVEALMGDL